MLPEYCCFVSLVGVGPCKSVEIDCQFLTSCWYAEFVFGGSKKHGTILISLTVCHSTLVGEWPMKHVQAGLTYDLYPAVPSSQPRHKLIGYHLPNLDTN